MKVRFLSYADVAVTCGRDGYFRNSDSVTADKIANIKAAADTERRRRRVIFGSYNLCITCMDCNYLTRESPTHNLGFMNNTCTSLPLQKPAMQAQSETKPLTHCHRTR